MVKILEIERILTERGILTEGELSSVNSHAPFASLNAHDSIVFLGSPSTKPAICTMDFSVGRNPGSKGYRVGHMHYH